MKQPTPVTTKAKRRPRCKQCRKQFYTTSTTAIYCSRPCKQNAANLKKRVQYVDRASDSAFMFMLAAECIRAESLQCLEALRNNIPALVELYSLYKYHLRANEWGATSTWSLCHIAPAVGKSSIGQFHPANLVVAPATMNRIHSNKHFGHGLSVRRSELLPMHSVHQKESRKSIVQRIIEYLGESTVQAFSSLVKLKSTNRLKVLNWLLDNLDPKDPIHAKHLKGIDKLSTKALSALKASIEGKEPAKQYKMITEELQYLSVFTTELLRHSNYRVDLVPLAEFLSQQGIDDKELMFRLSAEDCDSLFNGLFALLHGRELSAVADSLMPALTTLHALGRFKCELPVFPVVEPVPGPSPVVVLKTFKSFADELDGECVEAPSVLLQGHSASCEIEPLPWE